MNYPNNNFTNSNSKETNTGGKCLRNSFKIILQNIRIA